MIGESHAEILVSATLRSIFYTKYCPLGLVTYTWIFTSFIHPSSSLLGPNF